MKVKKVVETTNIKDIQNNTFIFCKSLNNGFVKRDLSTLNITDYSFQNVMETIKNLPLDELESKKLNSVTFDKGSIKSSLRLNKYIDHLLSKLPKFNSLKEIHSVFNNIKLKRKYIDDNIINDDKLKTLINSLELSNYINIISSNRKSKDFFASKVVLKNNKIAVSASLFDANSTNDGAVFLYDVDGSNEKMFVATAGGHYQDFYGSSIAMSDTKIAIGATGISGNESKTGGVYLYDIDGSNEMIITATDSKSQDYFGNAVALSSDKIIIGAKYNDDKGDRAGVVYIYDLNGTNEIKIYPSDAKSKSYFGTSIATNGKKIVIGAYKANGKGAVYVYDMDGTNEIKISPTNSSYFGYDVAINDNKIIIGAPRDNGKGAVYIYDLNGSNEIKIISSNGVKSDYFGNTVDICDTNIIVSAPGKNTYELSDSGSCYVFDIDGSNEVEIIPPKTIVEAKDKFGSSVAIDNDNIVIGASGDDNYTGSFYTYSYKTK